MKQLATSFVFSLVAAIFLTKAALGDVIGRVRYIDEDNTFDLCVHDTCNTIRLCGINAPEKDQVGYFASKQALTMLVSGQILHCLGVGDGSVCDGRSKRMSYDRLVAQCFTGNIDIGEAMVSK